MSLAENQRSFVGLADLYHLLLLLLQSVEMFAELVSFAPTLPALWMTLQRAIPSQLLVLLCSESVRQLNISFLVLSSCFQLRACSVTLSDVKTFFDAVASCLDSGLTKRHNSCAPGLTSGGWQRLRQELVASSCLVRCKRLRGVASCSLWAGLGSYLRDKYSRQGRTIKRCMPIEACWFHQLRLPLATKLDLDCQSLFQRESNITD